MATSKGANTYNRQNWEDSDFPTLCQTCLGDNPYIRMMKDKYGMECKVCERPFTVFRWCPGARMRFKKTEVCQTCAKLRNICQTCLLDLEYGLPTQVRDAALKVHESMPKSDVNKEYYTQNMEREIANTEGVTAVGPYAGAGKSQNSHEMLMKLARTAPYYKRNRPHVCSFWVKGECKRGEECPYRHEKPTDPDDPLSDQNIRDRYYGINDPVAEKLMSRYSTLPKLEPPEDKAVCTLYVGNLGEDEITETDLRNYFYQFGELRAVSLVSRQQCSFIQFTTRAAAEEAVEKTFNKLVMHGRRLNIKWGKSPGQTAEGGGNLIDAGPALPASLPAPPTELDYFGLHTSAATASHAAAMASLPGSLPPPPPMAPRAPPPRSVRMPPPPPGMMPMHPPPMPPMLRPQGYGSRAPPPAPGVSYPSQDPTRMGATGSKAPVSAATSSDSNE